MDQPAVDRTEILSRLADLARRDLEIDILYAEQGQGLNEEWMNHQHNKLRADLEAGLEFFATFSTSVLAELDQDLQQHGVLSRTVGISLNDGDPNRPKRVNPTILPVEGIAAFISSYRGKYSSERFIRDFLMFPSSWPTIQVIYDALNLFGPRGLAEAAARYSREAIERLISIEQAIYELQWDQARKLTMSTGYAYGDDMAARSQNFAHMTPALAHYVLTEAPTDEELATRLTRKPVNGFAVPLPGITRDDILKMLQRYGKQ